MMCLNHSRSRIITAVLLAAAVLIFMSAACSGERNIPVLAYQDRVADASAILAVEFLRDSKQFSFTRFSSGSLTAEALITGSADFATMGDAAAVNIASRYPDSIVLLWVHGDGYDRHRLVSRTAAPERIGVKFGTSTHAALVSWLQSSSLWADGEPLPQLIDMSPDLQLSALDSGEIEALAASEPTPTIALEKVSGTFAVPLIVEGRRYPVFLVSTRRALEKYPEAVQLLYEAMQYSSLRAARASAGGDADALDILVTGTGLDRQKLDNSMRHHRFGLFSIDDYLGEMAELAEFMLGAGSISDVPVWSEVER